MLHRRSGQRDIVVGVPVQGRPSAEYEDVIGYFVEQVAIRATAGPMPSLVHQVRDLVLEAFEHGGYPLSRIDGLTGQGRRSGIDLRAAFVFQNWFTQADRTLVDHDGALPRLEPVLEVHQQGVLDLSLEVCRTDDSYTLLFVYDPDLFDRTTVIGVADAY